MTSYVRDAAAVLGVVLVSYGAWLAYAPAGFVIGGALVLAGALLSARGD